MPNNTSLTMEQANDPKYWKDGKFTGVDMTKPYKTNADGSYTQLETSEETEARVNRPVYTADELDGTSYAQPKLKSEAEIRAQKLNEAQAMIDATEATYQDQLKNLRQSGQENQNATAAIMSAAGSAGDPFADAARRRTQEQTNKTYDAAAKDRVAEIKRIKSGANDKADTAYQSELTRYQTELNDYNTKVEKQSAALAAKKAAKRTAMSEIVTNLAKGGHSLDEVTDQELADAGMTRFEATALWGANSPQAGAKFEVKDGRAYSYYIDPKTGKAHIDSQEVPGAANGQYDQKIMDDGTLLLIPKTIDPSKTNYGIITVGKYQKPTSGSSVTYKEIDGKTYAVNPDGSLSNPKTPAATKENIDAMRNADDSPTNILARLTELRNDPTKTSGFWASGAAKVPGTSAYAFKSKIDSLKSLMTMKNLGLLKGAMSDKDVAFLTSLTSNLDISLPEEQFNAELDRLIGKFTELSSSFNANLDRMASGSQNSGTQAIGQSAPKDELDSLLDSSGFKSVGGDTNGAAGTPMSKNDQLDKLVSAIGQYESDGNYQAVGPVVTSGMYKGDRAVGKYQVMGKNVPSWTKIALGKSMTVEQFKNSPEAQDAVARHFLGQSLQEHGTPEDAASVWFSGRPLAKAGNAKDVIGTSVPQYVKAVRSLMNRV